MKNISAIAAVSKNTKGIGRNNKLLFDIPEDMAFFREMTSGKTVLFGYHTYMSLPKRPLPKRVNIVLTRKQINLEGAVVMHSAEEVLDYAGRHMDDEIMICGGEAVYREFLPYISGAYITEVVEDTPVEADTFFPELDEREWELVNERFTESGRANKPGYSFCEYRRRF